MSINKLFSALTIQTRNIQSYRHLHPKKFASVLQSVPVKPRSAWQIFVRDNFNPYSGGKEGLSKASTELSSKWRALSDQEKKKYYDLYETEKAAHEKAFDEAINSATSKQINDENLLRKKYKLPLLKDPKKPKKPLNGYMSFYQDVRKNNFSAIEGHPVSEQAKIIARMFNELPEAEKKAYNDKGVQAYKTYKQQMDEYRRTATEAGIV